MNVLVVLNVALWVAVVINFLLVLRVLRWMQAQREAGEYQRTREARPELAPGDRAPHFRTTTLTGEDFGFDDIAARETALIFLSPHCATCRGAVPGLVKLAKAARDRSDADIVLVSNGSTRESREWLDSIEQSERIDVDLRVLVAKDDSDFQERYNPRGMSPYYCHVDSDGIVTASGGLHSPGWANVAKRWLPSTGSLRASRRFG